MRLILQELRHQRGTHGEDFSYPKMIALVLQIIAIFCLIGGLWMGASDENYGLLLRWMGAGLLFQGATISSLLFAR